MEIGYYIVHVVDDEETVRKSIAFLLSVSGFPVRMHESATAFLGTAPTIRDGCLVTDLRMADMSGVELLQRLRGMAIKIPTIVITGHGDVPMAVEAMKAGAVDFIEKPFEDTVLISAVQRAAQELSISESGQDIEAIKGRLEGLTEREREILNGVVAGLPNKSIAYDLAISPRTVEVHRANVMTKMGAKSLPELVRMAIAAGVTGK
jgi:two-component system response regulator FixJ